MIQGIDGFVYKERQAWNKEGSEGAKFKYVCLDSLQNRSRKSNAKKEGDSGETDTPTHDCGGAIHIRFSTKREAVNVMYVHNPIHRVIESRPADNQG